MDAGACFTVQDLMLMIGGLMTAIGTPVGLMFRAMRDDNKYLRDLLSDQLEIGREQNAISQATVETVKTLRNSRRQ